MNEPTRISRRGMQFKKRLDAKRAAARRSNHDSKVAPKQTKEINNDG